MKQFFDFLPLLVFFAVYKFVDIYAATGALVVATAAQIGYSYFRHKRVEKMHIITFALVAVFGTLTLLFRDDAFIKWKVTVVNFLFAAFLLGSQLLGKPIVKTMLSKELTLPDTIWARVNSAWALFFFACGAANIYVAFWLPQEVWVNFKVFGLLGLTLLFTVATVGYLYRFLPKEQNGDSESSENITENK